MAKLRPSEAPSDASKAPEQESNERAFRVVEGASSKAVTAMVVGPEEKGLKDILRHLEKLGHEVESYERFMDADAALLRHRHDLRVLVVAARVGVSRGLDLLNQTRDGRIYPNRILRVFVPDSIDPIPKLTESKHQVVDALLPRNPADQVPVLEVQLRLFDALVAARDRYAGALKNARDQELLAKDSSKAAVLLADRSLKVDLHKEGSAPARRVDRNPLSPYSGSAERHQVVFDADWDVERSIEDCSDMLGIDIRALESIASDGKGKEEPVTLHLGPGNLGVMDEFRSSGSKSRQVGIAKAVEYRLDGILKQALLPHYADDELLHAFVWQLANIVMQNEGLKGRRIVNLLKPADQNRLRVYLLRAAESGQAQRHALGRRHTKTTRPDDVYAHSKSARISRSLIKLFEDFVGDPQAFFREYFQEEMHPDSANDMRAILPLRTDHMLFARFEEIGPLFKGRLSEERLGTMFPNANNEQRDEFRRNRGRMHDFVLDVKSFSHLPNNEFTRALNEVIARLHRGGIAVMNGFEESYTGYQRIPQLRHIMSRMGSDYRCYLVGNGSGPKSVVIERRQIKANRSFPFLGKTKLGPHALAGNSVISIDDYERVWPRRALHNALLQRSVKLTEAEVVERVARTESKPGAIRTWKRDFMPRASAIVSLVEAHSRTPGWKRGVKLIQEPSQGIQRQTKLAKSQKKKGKAKKPPISPSLFIEQQVAEVKRRLIRSDNYPVLRLIWPDHD